MTGSSTELSTAISTGTRVFSTTNSTDTGVLSESQYSDNLSPTSPHSSDTNSLPLPSTSNVLQSSFRVNHCCGSFQSLSPSFQILKFDNFETSVPSISDIPNCHCPSTLTSNGSQFSIMEEECNDTVSDKKMSKDKMDLTQILTMLTHQITNQNTAIQDYIQKNDMKFDKMVQDNENFKNAMRAELDDLRALLRSQNYLSQSHASTSNVSSQVSSSSTPQLAPPTPSTSSPIDSSATTVSSPLGSSATSSADMQTQMLLLLSESFSKLLTALSEKKEDTKSDWPKFSGDHKKFRPWYLAIMAQLLLAPWKDLYDPVTNTVVKHTTNGNLNGKLYAKLLLSLEGSVLENVVS
jgi:hypothetical protein